jgi:hypothetical protein
MPQYGQDSRRLTWVSDRIPYLGYGYALFKDKELNESPSDSFFQKAGVFTKPKTPAQRNP